MYIWSAGDGSTTLVAEMGGGGMPGGNGLGGNLLFTSLLGVSDDLLSL